MNLPKRILYKQNNAIYYTYDASGVKWAKEIHKDGGIKRFDYLGNFVYEDHVLKYIITDYGKIVISKVNNPFIRYYDLRDHLGNVRASFRANDNNTLTLLQEDSYYPFGMQQPAMSYLNRDTEHKNLYLYNGKELQTDFDLNWYDYGARFYDVELVRWHVVDPLAEKYIFLSPYDYCDNNPIKYYDKDGMKIKPANQNEFNTHKKRIKRKYMRLHNKKQKLYSKGASTTKISKLSDRLEQLKQALENLNTIDNSPVVYELNKLSPETFSEGFLSYNADGNNGNGSIIINYISGSTSNFAHESTHAAQYESNEVAFADATSGDDNLIALDLYDEVAAYKIQYAYSPESVSSLNSNRQIDNINNITPDWVKNIYNTVKKTYPYRKPYYGLVPVNTSSTVQILTKAYPGFNFKEYNPNATLKQLFPNIIER